MFKNTLRVKSYIVQTEMKPIILKNLVMTLFRRISESIRKLLQLNIYCCRYPARISEGIILFPVCHTVVCCGLVGIIAIKKRAALPVDPDIDQLEQMTEIIDGRRLDICLENNLPLSAHYLGGPLIIRQLMKDACSLKKNGCFYKIFQAPNEQEKIVGLANRLTILAETEFKQLKDQMGFLDAHDVNIISDRIESLKDIAWCFRMELVENIRKIKTLLSKQSLELTYDSVTIFCRINAVLNSLDRLEVRGRDSAGISLMMILEKEEYLQFQKMLQAHENPVNLIDAFQDRLKNNILLNQDISISGPHEKNGRVGITLTYKVAAEIGSLGDNIRFLRKQITEDPFLHLLASRRHTYHTISAHTRWASVGAITEANCHPSDNRVSHQSIRSQGVIHACLNGDIDNYPELKAEYERNGGKIDSGITTDTKIIPLQINQYINQGESVAEAFRLAVNDFKGSHAIAMHTDLAPGKIFLAQRGSGQAIFVGLADHHYMPASEVYGFVEETSEYLKLDGEKTIPGENGAVQGQIFVLDQDSVGGLDGITACYYDGTPVLLGPDDIKHTQITSRDIDRQSYPYYFLKEISESPDSVEKTLMNRWKVSDDSSEHYHIHLDKTVFPNRLQSAFTENRIKHIFLIGQGTAGIAAKACGNIMDHYLDDPKIQIRAMKASELSGFKLPSANGTDTMADSLVIAISQSGTTTDTNRAVDMVRERGAYILAIVNRRDSDLTFKADGVMYTSSGRDLEMSVASTKAFYSQIVAGAILGLYIASFKKRKSDEFVTREIKQLLNIPGYMRDVLSMKEEIAGSAKRLAVSKTYWAAVGSGHNKASSDEIRIKLSELCYKTISTDCVEDKKHIDLSSEPMIMVCAAGTRETVIKDIIKDIAIFKAHKASTVVIANQGENRFADCADDIFYVPVIEEHLSPILNTLVGHLWGYYAALAINESSKFLDAFREEIRCAINEYTANGMDTYEIILEKSFRETIGRFDRELRQKIVNNQFPGVVGLSCASDLSLLLKYLSGRLPLTDFEIDFGIKGTPSNVLNTFFKSVGNAINALARPVDAIKHQAKTVTVGTSRISEKIEKGILFDALDAYKFTVAQLTPNNILVLRNVQKIIASIKGAILYRILGLDLMGEITDKTAIEVVKKEGVLKPIPSRVETDNQLTGTKRIIVKEKNVYIGKGRKDSRSIVVIPITSGSHARANVIEYLLLLNVAFKESIDLNSKIRALGGKYERIKNIVQENSITWQDEFIEMLDMKELFGSSAEKIGEYIVSSQKL